MTTHILIELDHPPFEVTRESIESLPDWAENGWFFGNNVLRFDHYLIAYRGKVEVWPPEDVAKYIKPNPYEACAKVVKDMISPGSVNRSAAIRSIRHIKGSDK